jgi:hypothetical protein
MNKQLRLLIGILLLEAGYGPTLTAQGVAPRDIARAAAAALVTVTSRDVSGTTVGTGSGFFVSADGVLVTNYHVVEGAHSLRIELADSSAYDNVFLVTADPQRDLAVLKIPVERQAFLTLGADSTVQMGDNVYVMGNPLGLERTFSDGMLSARRTLAGRQLLQITAPISHGSSGGPVLNTDGAVIGVATSFVSEGQNLNLAVPTRYVRPLLSTGEAPRRFTASLAPPRAASGADRAEGGGGTAPRTGRSTASGTSTRYIEQSTRQIRARTPSMTRLGYRQVGELRTGFAEDGEPGVFRIALTAGRTYAFVGACDNDCTDVDLAIYDYRITRELESDRAVDDTPTVVYIPARSGTYTIAVEMAECDTRLCSYAVGVFVK